MTYLGVEELVNGLVLVMSGIDTPPPRLVTLLTLGLHGKARIGRGCAYCLKCV